MKRNTVTANISGSSVPVFLLFLSVIFFSAGVWAVEPPNTVPPPELRPFSKPELHISSLSRPLQNIRNRLPNSYAESADRFAARYGQNFQIHLDPRSGTPTNILGRIAIIPGRGNSIQAELRGQSGGTVSLPPDAAVVSAIMKDFFLENRDVLNLDISQLGTVTARQINNSLWHIQATQEVNSIPVRRARLAGTISHGNLVMFGTENWGDVRLSTKPAIDSAEALALGFQHIGGKLPEDNMVREPRLEIVPVAPLHLQTGELYDGPAGEGYEHRLVWTFLFTRAPGHAAWEIILDALTGELLSLADINHYVTSAVTGGVYPLANTGICASDPTCGIMQPDQPMPYADTGQPSPNEYTGSAGQFDYSFGEVITRLIGKFVKIQDTCGTLRESVFGSGGLSLGGENGQHDCESGGSSAGNTAAARTAYYEINRVQEMARGYLPSNTWLTARLTANVNIEDTCNAYFDTLNSTVNFFRSGGGCRNTGEIAGVFDHEWAHGLDQNDGNGLSNPSESYADIAAMYRLQKSCMGYGFFATLDRGCGQTADLSGFNTRTSRTGTPRCALNCSGVRDTDWAQLTNPAMTPDTPANFACTRCGSDAYGYNGPCGKQAHCESAVDTQAAWDFAARDLQAPPYGYDANTAFIIANRIFYSAAGNIGNWHTCACGATPDETTSNGCGVTNAYMQWLAADDDDGNIQNGTPHMTALYNAFSRHGIACDTLTPVDSGCAGVPAAAPVIGITAGDGLVDISWSADPAATQYRVFRTEGYFECDSGKTLIATVNSGGEYTDYNVANNRQYCYSVMAASGDTCFSPASNCVCVEPAPASRGEIWGTVLDDVTGSPLMDAVITATGGFATSSDGSGVYRFGDLPSGTYEISVSRFGYGTRTFPGISVPNGGTVQVDVGLDPLLPVTVMGTVSDGTGHGWPLYAKIDITAFGYAVSLYTDPATGMYSTDLYPGTPYAFSVSSIGYNPATRTITPDPGGNTADFSLTTDPEICAPGYGMLYTESFENSNGGYSTNIFSDWEWGAPSSGPDNAHSGVNVWATNLAGPFTSYDDFYIVSPVIDLSSNAGRTSVLSWWQWLDNDWGDAVASVEVSNNSGATWTELYRYRGIIDTWSRQSVALSTSYSVSTFRVRFRMTTGDWCMYVECGPPPAGWYIDDVSVLPQGGCQFTPGSLMVGAVRDAVSGIGLNNAKITDGAGHTAYTGPTPGDPLLDDGFFSLFLPSGIHDLLVSFPGYQPLTVSGITLPNDSLYPQDFLLELLAALTITTETLPAAFIGSTYSHVLEASGGLPPYFWELPGMYNQLPEGLALDTETGLISGTPSTSTTGAYSFTVQVTDAAGNSTSKYLSLDLLYPYTLSTGINIYCTTGSDCIQSLTISGGAPPYAWEILSGELPAGLSFDSATGTVSGRPLTAGISNFSVRRIDAGGADSQRTVTLTIYPRVISYLPADGAAVFSSTPVQVTFSDPINFESAIAGGLTLTLGGAARALAAGCGHTVALKNDGTLLAWGGNDHAQTIIPGGLTSVASITAGCNHSLALRTDGTVVAWGDTSQGQTSVPVDLSGVKAVAAGAFFSMALKENGTVVAWGWGVSGATNVPENLNGVIAISGGDYHALALKSDGTVVAWGDSTFVPPDHTGIVAIAAGAYHNVALKSDGTLVTWGQDDYGQISVPRDLSGIIAVAAGSFHTLALKNDGTVVAWGWNDYGQTSVPEDLTGVVAIAAGNIYSTALKNDGSVVSWGGGDAQSKVPFALKSAGNAVSGSVAYDAASLTATFTPSAPLLVNSTYYAMVSGVSSQTGVPLAGPVRWSFKVRDLQITTASLAVGVLGANYSRQLAATGGSAPYHWWVSSGSLPAGLTLDSATGTISGIPAVAGDYHFGITVSCSTSSDTKEYSLHITDNAVRIPGPFQRYFSLIQEAYDDLSANEVVIEAKGIEFSEDLSFERDIAVTLKGGCADDYSDGSTSTGLRGTVTIIHGEVIIDKLTILP